MDMLPLELKSRAGCRVTSHILTFLRFSNCSNQLSDMPGKRGALLILEGCDRSGKSTQVKKLVDSLNALGIVAESRAFPNRKTIVGQVIDKFLSKTIELPAKTAHLLFSANRWECAAEMIDALMSGTTLVVDRYAASGAAYTSAITGKDIQWCKEPDNGLPKPDLVALIEVDEDTQISRQNWGSDLFDKIDLQRKVAANLRMLSDDSWITINGNASVETIHEKLLSAALERIETAKLTPLGKLYESNICYS